MALGRAAILIGVAVVLGILLLQVGSRPPVRATSSAVAASATTTTTTAPATTTTAIPRSSVHVLVANGTTVPNAATNFTTQLQAQGWQTLPPVDATSSVSSSGVYYAAGKQAAAAAVAAAVGAKPTAVQALTSSLPVSSVAGADVVVVLGPDLATHAPTT